MFATLRLARLEHLWEMAILEVSDYGQQRPIDTQVYEVAEGYPQVDSARL